MPRRRGSSRSRSAAHPRVTTTIVVTRVGRKRSVKIDLRGRRAGTYAVLIQAQGRKAIKRLYTTCGAGNVTGFNLKRVR